MGKCLQKLTSVPVVWNENRNSNCKVGFADQMCIEAHYKSHYQCIDSPVGQALETIVPKWRTILIFYRKFIVFRMILFVFEACFFRIFHCRSDSVSESVSIMLILHVSTHGPKPVGCLDII